MAWQNIEQAYVRASNMLTSGFSNSTSIPMGMGHDPTPPRAGQCFRHSRAMEQLFGGCFPRLEDITLVTAGHDHEMNRKWTSQDADIIMGTSFPSIPPLAMMTQVNPFNELPIAA
jgi:hypothetical protein